MKEFKFECEFEGILGKYRKIVCVKSNHLQGAIRKLYQNESGFLGVKKILN